MTSSEERAIQDLIEKSIRQELAPLHQSVNTAIHVCHQTQNFTQINTRLGSIETDVKALLKSSGSSTTIEKLVMLVAAAVIAAAVSYAFRPAAERGALLNSRASSNMQSQEGRP